MSFTKVADATVAIPIGNGKSKYIKIGSVLENSNNDSSKGLPYMLMLDPFLDLGTLHRLGQFQGDSIPVSFYKTRNADWPPSSGPGSAASRAPREPAPPSARRDLTDLDDDIPF